MKIKSVLLVGLAGFALASCGGVKGYKTEVKHKVFTDNIEKFVEESTLLSADDPFSFTINANSKSNTKTTYFKNGKSISEEKMEIKSETSCEFDSANSVLRSKGIYETREEDASDVKTEKYDGDIVNQCDNKNFYEVDMKSKVYKKSASSKPADAVAAEASKAIKALSAFIAQMSVFDEAKYGLYDFFSIFSHPFFTFDKEAYIRLMSNRDEMIDMVLDYVLKYICNSSLWIDDCKEMSFEDVFTNNPILENNRMNILSLNVLFENTINKSCYFDDGCDLCRIMYLQKINDLMGSMMVNFAIGYREQVIVDFKNFIELSAVDSYLGHCDSESEYKTLKKAFDVTTLLSICNISGLLNEQTDKKYFEKEMRELYEKFYKERYQLNDFEEFYNNVVNNSLYFIFKDKKSYKSVVRKMFDDIYYLNQDLSKSIYTTFQIANDFAHAGGYSFNASPGMVDDCATKVLCFVLLHLKIVLINIIEVSKEHNKTVEFNQEFKYINDMMEYYTEINEKIVKDYSTKLN